MTAVAGVTALVSSLKGLLSYGSQIVNMASHFEQTRKGLETVLQSAEKGKQLFEDLRKFSFETTFGVDELASASTQLLNVGMNVKDLNKNLKMLGDLAQGDKSKFAELTSVFSKITAQGKASMIQLQQFALRGVPVIQTLKEMGITGGTSAENLTKALEKLTEEGGQFHNAMENIIDTIEGKRGFIDDTFKEILVNFGEVTGITDAYKSYLDVLYELLDKINNKLAEWNENPVMKAILRGVLVTALGGIVSIIASALIPALGTVIVKLTAIAGLKSLITGGLVGLGVSLVAGVGIGIASYINDQKQLGLETEKANEKLKEQLGLLYAGNQKGYYESVIGTKAEELKKLNDELDYLKQNSGKNVLLTDNKFDLAKQSTYTQSKFSLTMGSVEAQLSKIKALENEIETAQNNLDIENYKANSNTLLDSIYNQFLLSSNDEQVAEIEKNINALQEYLNFTQTKWVRDEDGTFFEKVIGLDEDTKTKISKSITYLKSELERLKPSTDTLKWWELFENVTGVSSTTSEGVKKGSDLASDYIAQYQKMYDDAVQFEKDIGMYTEDTSTEIAKKMVEEIRNQIETLLGTELDSDNFAITDASIQGMIQALQTFKDMIPEIEEETYSLKDSLKEMVDGLLSGTDVGNFLSSIKNANTPEEAVIETLANALINVVGGIEGVDVILNVVTESLKAFAPILKTVMFVFLLVAKTTSALSKAFMEFIDKISFGLFKKISNAWDKLATEQETEAERLKRLNEQYKNLTQAIQDQQEYYLSKKTAINSDSYMTDLLGARRVNDMILTDKGVFSTSPQDTIMAMKHPENLASATMIQPIINNYAGDEVEVQTQTRADGMQELIVNISRKVAGDYADGVNGWDSAYMAKQMRLTGRSLS